MRRSTTAWPSGTALALTTSLGRGVKSREELVGNAEEHDEFDEREARREQRPALSGLIYSVEGLYHHASTPRRTRRRAASRSIDTTTVGGFDGKEGDSSPARRAVAPPGAPMVMKFLRGLLSPRSAPPETSPAEASVEYNGYTITPAPEKGPGGWRIAGTISRELDGERKVHTFGRADTSPDRAAIVVMTIETAKRIIEEQGDRIFSAREPHE